MGAARPISPASGSLTAQMRSPSSVGQSQSRGPLHRGYKYHLPAMGAAPTSGVLRKNLRSQSTSGEAGLERPEGVRAEGYKRHLMRLGVMPSTPEPFTSPRSQRRPPGPVRSQGSVPSAQRYRSHLTAYPASGRPTSQMSRNALQIEQFLNPPRRGTGESALSPRMGRRSSSQRKGFPIRSNFLPQRMRRSSPSGRRSVSPGMSRINTPFGRSTGVRSQSRRRFSPSGQGMSNRMRASTRAQRTPSLQTALTSQKATPTSPLLRLALDSRYGCD